MPFEKIDNIESNVYIEPICNDNSLFSYRSHYRGYSIISFDIIVEDL